MDPNSEASGGRHSASSRLAARLKSVSESPWFLLFAIGTAAVLRLPNFRESLWFDELWSTHLKLASLIQLGNHILFDVHPPLYTAFMFFWIRVFGDSEISVRMPSLIAGLLSIFLAYHLSAKLIDKATAGLVAVFLGLSPVHIWYSQEARPYSLACFLLVLAIFSFHQIRSTDPNSARKWEWIYLASGLCGVLVHYYVLPLLGVVMLLSLLDRVKRPPARLLKLNLLILLAFGAFMAMRVLLGGIRSELSYLRPFTLAEWWNLFFRWFLTANSLGSESGLQRLLLPAVQIAFVGIFVVGVARLIAQFRMGRKLESLALLLYLVVLPAMLLGLTLLGFGAIYIERSAYVLLPFFYLVIACGITAARTLVLRRAMVVFTVSVTIWTTVSFFQRGDQWTVYKPNEDWRSAAQVLGDELSQNRGPAVAFVTVPVLSLTYYDPRIGETGGVTNRAVGKLERIQHLVGSTNPVGRRLAVEIQEYIRSSSAEIEMETVIAPDAATIHRDLQARRLASFYLVHDKFWSAGFRRLQNSVMRDPTFELERSWTFKGIEIYRFRSKFD